MIKSRRNHLRKTNKQQYNLEIAQNAAYYHENMYSTSDEFNEVYDMFCPEDNYKEKKVVQEDNLDALLREYNL